MAFHFASRDISKYLSTDHQTNSAMNQLQVYVLFDENKLFWVDK